MKLPSTEQVNEALRAVIDPELRRSIVDLGMVRSIEVRENGKVEVVVSLTTPGCPIRSHFQQAVATNVAALEGVTEVGVGFDVLTDDEKGRLQEALGRPGGLPEGALAQVKNVICVASGKGGVGKSTMTANLAAALQAEGQSSGALDCDVYGYSIPRMLGIDERPDVNAERKIIPPLGPAGIKVMSIGFFLERNAAVVWRGPMLHKAIQQFLEDVAWEDVDYLLLDLPPGTGDVSMTLAQLLPQARVVVVTTPQPAAQSVARRAADMAAKVDLELLGVIENMSGFTTPDGQRFTIFGEGGGQLLADELDVPLLGKVPLAEELREHSDTGVPLVLDQPDHPASQAIRAAAHGIIAATPQELPVMQAESPAAPAPAPRSAAPSCRSSRFRARSAGRRASRSIARWWDERVPLHVASDFYDVERFRAGGSTLRPFELERGRRRHRQATRPPSVPLRARHALLGPPRRLGRRARLLRARSRGARTSSPPRPRSTRASSRPTSTTPSRRSAASGSTSSIRASERSTGFRTSPAGPGWSASCSPSGGFLYLAEFHPFTWCLLRRRAEIDYDYFHAPDRAPVLDDDEQGSYADLDAATEHNATIEWAHPLADVVDAVLGCGLRLELLHEQDHTLFPASRTDLGSRRAPRRGQLPPAAQGLPRLPLMFSLRARRES